MRLWQNWRDCLKRWTLSRDDGAVPVVILDANILYSSVLTDLFLWLGVVRAIRAHWTQDIHQEWVRNLANKRPDLADRIERRKDAMDRALPAALVTGYRPKIEQLALPDENDRHVLAAAIEVEAQVIVTQNTRDFPDDLLAPYGVRACHPDSFACDLLELNADRVIEAVRSQRSQLVKPSRSPEELLDIFQRNDLPGFAARLKRHVGSF